MPAVLKKSIEKPRRTTVTLSVEARQIAERHARARRVNFGEALSALVVEAEANRPQTRLEIRDGWPVFVPPPGTPKLTLEMVKQAMDEEW